MFGTNGSIGRSHWFCRVPVGNNTNVGLGGQELSNSRCSDLVPSSCRVSRALGAGKKVECSAQALRFHTPRRDRIRESTTNLNVAESTFRVLNKVISYWGTAEVFSSCESLRGCHPIHSLVPWQDCHASSVSGC